MVGARPARAVAIGEDPQAVAHRPCRCTAEQSYYESRLACLCPAIELRSSAAEDICAIAVVLTANATSNPSVVDIVSIKSLDPAAASRRQSRTGNTARTELSRCCIFNAVERS